jgi:thiamine-monophosphate kinase
MTHDSPEFDVIARHFTRPAPNAVLGVGDDSALVQLSRGMELAISVDTMVSGTHFFPDVDPENLGHKALAVNLSDMAAMGAMPYWAMLALTLPKVDHDWLAAFAKGFFDLAEEFGVTLIGGDTTRGPLTLTVTIMGEVPAGASLRRSGAKAGNDVWVSGHLGDAALAVAHRHGKLQLDEADYREAVMRLYEPTPRVALGQALRGLATAAIDISTASSPTSATSASSRRWARWWSSPRCRSRRSPRSTSPPMRGATPSSPAATTTSSASPRTPTRARS